IVMPSKVGFGALQQTSEEIEMHQLDDTEDEEHEVQDTEDKEIQVEEKEKLECEEEEEVEDNEQFVIKNRKKKGKNQVLLESSEESEEVDEWRNHAQQIYDYEQDNEQASNEQMESKP
ncbi:unnamed protein product, partial [Ilex paraguariensis]